jgi:hypothetical protein
MGVFFLTTDDGFDTAPYRYVFGSIHRPVWGLVFLISGSWRWSPAPSQTRSSSPPRSS